MKKRKAKRIKSKDGIDTKINEFYNETEREKEVKLLNLIADVIIRITLEEFYSQNPDE